MNDLTGTTTAITFKNLYSTTTTTISYARKVMEPKKEAGWCEKNDVVHAWEVQDYVLTTDPPQSVRICVNCGKRETRFNTVTYPDWK